MKELNIIQLVINQISMTWCPETGEKLTVERDGWNGDEKTPLCEPCTMKEDCPIQLTGNYGKT